MIITTKANNTNAPATAPAIMMVFCDRAGRTEGRCEGDNVSTVYTGRLTERALGLPHAILGKAIDNCAVNAMLLLVMMMIMMIMLKSMVCYLRDCSWPSLT